MVAYAPSFNPYVTTNAAGSFIISSDGYVQGVAMDDPETRYSLAGGVLAQSETLPMWGGVMIYENVAASLLTPPSGTDVGGGGVGRALSQAGASGFSVFNQLHHAIITPGSPVPAVGSGASVHFHRFGSGARIPLALSAALVSALVGGPTTQQVSWDFNLQELAPYAPVAANENITGITWNGGVATVTTATPHGYSVGDQVTIAGATPSGFNGDFPIATVPATTAFTYALAANPGTETVPGIVVAGGGLLPVRILDLHVGNSKVVTYSPAANTLSWNNQGNVALCLI